MGSVRVPPAVCGRDGRAAPRRSQNTTGGYPPKKSDLADTPLVPKLFLLRLLRRATTLCPPQCTKAAWHHLTQRPPRCVWSLRAGSSCWSAAEMAALQSNPLPYSSTAEEKTLLLPARSRFDGPQAKGPV